MEPHGTSWNLTEPHEIPWTIVECLGTSYTAYHLRRHQPDLGDQQSSTDGGALPTLHAPHTLSTEEVAEKQGVAMK
jgi:hypothetical protein